MNKKRIAALSLAVVLLVSACAFGIYRYDLQKKFSYSEKNTFSMGTVVSQKVYSPHAAKHIEKVNALISSLEKVISRNIETSSVSTLNTQGEVFSAEVASVLRSCEEISELTGGAFDVTVGKLVDLWSFDGENRVVPDENRIAELLSEVGYGKLEINGGSIVLSSEASVDLGAVGKGLACDNAVTYYKAVEDCSGAVISVGGSIGCFGQYNKAGDKWRIAVRHPREENAFLGVISLSEGFVSTSGDYEKYFIENSERYHHILDARTGYPADSGLISVTVICDSGFLSDALSTACFLLGKDESIGLLEKYNASAIFVDENMEITTVGEVEFEKQ